MEIIQNCVFTILICTWSVQHLNVPAPKDSKVIILVRKIRWMIISILFPEFVLAHAIGERHLASKSMHHLKGLDRFVLNDDRPWWKAFLDKVSPSSNLDHSSEPTAAKMTDEESNCQYEMNIRTQSNKHCPSPDSFRNSDIEANSQN